MQTEISKTDYHLMMSDIYAEEKKTFKAQIQKFNKETPYYVYFLCHPNGDPFYIGKGKGKRAFDHNSYILRNKQPKTIKENTISNLIEIDEYPIVYMYKGNLSQTEALNLEEGMIEYFGRMLDGGTLTNVMPGGIISYFYVCSKAGKIGGKKTRENNSGIFDPNYDRSATAKKTWREVLRGSNIDFSKFRKLGGESNRDNKTGMFREDLQHMRSDWARIGAKALEEAGTRSGTFSQKWRDDNRERFKEITSSGGKIGGKIVGSMFWWTDGIINKKALEIPGEGWTRGLTKDKNSNSFLTPWNNGIKCIKSKECPGEGWVRGMLIKGKL